MRVCFKTANINLELVQKPMSDNYYGPSNQPVDGNDGPNFYNPYGHNFCMCPQCVLQDQNEYRISPSLVINHYSVRIETQINEQNIHLKYTNNHCQFVLHQGRTDERICNEIRDNRTDQLIHYLVHAQYSYQCRACGKAFTAQQNLTAHIERKHLHISGHFLCETCHNIYQTRCHWRTTEHLGPTDLRLSR